MLLPTLNELPTARDLIDVFGGYNHNLRIGSGEFYDMKNLTSDNYPVMSPRKRRGVFVAEGEPSCMIAKDVFCYLNVHVVEGVESSSYMNFIMCRPEGDVTVSLGDYMEMLPGERYMISMGTNVIIFPDRIYVNTIKGEDGKYKCGKINVEYFPTRETFSITDIAGEFVDKQRIVARLCDAQGNELETHSEDIDQLPAVNDRQDGYLWWDLSDIFAEETPLRRWNAETKQWETVTKAETFVKVTSKNPGNMDSYFRIGDTIQISGARSPYYTTIEPPGVNGTHVIVDVGEDYIIYNGRILHEFEALINGDDSWIYISRRMPKMDYVVECGNRLWGCRFGESNDGEFVNEIYASALGDFTSWHSFEGVSTDSYVASVGTEGKFTGAVTHLGYPIFFKENCMHKVYGNYPSNYQIQTTSCRGVQDGCHKSLAVVNEVLYFKARTGVCAYDGSLPVEISSALGNEVYSDATAGALGNKYYISMKDSFGSYHMFVYDTSKGLWHREDDTQATEFCNCRGELYYIDYDGKQIKTVLGTGTLDTSAVEWEAITGTIGTDMPDKKYISRLDVRMLLNVGASVFIYAEYDSSGAWELLHSMNGISLRSFAIPIKPKRCDHLRLKIVGRGDAKIFSICKTIEQGSDV